MAKKIFHAVDFHENDYVMTCNTHIPSVDNNLKKNNTSTTIFNEFSSTYYGDKNDCFKFVSKKYTEKLC